MREIPEELCRGPFTVARAAELGMSRRVVDGARFRAPWPGVRVLSGAPDDLVHRCRAAALVLPPSAAFSHDTAVQLGGWLTPPRPERGPSRYAPDPRARGSIQVSVPVPLARPRFAGMIGHRVVWQPGDVGVLDGLRVTSPWRSWCDLAAAGADEVDLVILADALRRRYERDGARRLAARLDAWGGGRGVRVLRRALVRSRDRVDSPMETRLRLIFADAGLPEPEVNAWVRFEDGTPLHQPDLSWPRWRVAADYDGAHHGERDDDAAVLAGRASNWRRRQDTSRRDLLEEEGWTLRIFTAYDVFRAVPASVTRMREALRRAGAPG